MNARRRLHGPIAAWLCLAAVVVLAWAWPAAAQSTRISATYASSRAAFNAARRDARVPRTQRPFRIERVPMTDRGGRAVLDRAGRPVVTREYHFVSTRGHGVVIQDHSAGHSFADGGHEGPHFNVRPAHDTRHGQVPGTRPHYSYTPRRTR